MICITKIFCFCHTCIIKAFDRICEWSLYQWTDIKKGNKDYDNNMNEKELIYLPVFEQTKECRDIISWLIIIYEFIKS